MSQDDLTAMQERLGELERELARVSRRLNVALDLLGQCRIGGYPESVGIVEQRLEAAEKEEHLSAGAEEITATNRKAAPPRDADTPTPVTEAPPQASWQPFVPAEAPLSRKAPNPAVGPTMAQQTHRYDAETEKEKKMNRALEQLDGLGKFKK